MMPKTRAGLSLAALPVACVVAAKVFWVNLQTIPYLYPSHISGPATPLCAFGGTFFFFPVKCHRINAEMWGKTWQDQTCWWKYRRWPVFWVCYIIHVLQHGDPNESLVAVFGIKVMIESWKSVWPGFVDGALHLYDALEMEPKSAWVH